jgi:orotidine-5'-phosphate decarboxylase
MSSHLSLSLDTANPKDRLMVALDYETLSEARVQALKLKGVAGIMKIGLTALAQGGIELASALKAEGFAIFQDWKLHDIGAQVEGATHQLSKGPLDFLTLHATPQVMSAAIDGRSRARNKNPNHNPKLLGVTVLTSLSDEDLKAMGHNEAALDLVKRRVDQALVAGIDGVVASSLEASTIRAMTPKEFLIITPGIRPRGAANNDQVRLSTPESAIKAGATHLVVGRPITKDSNPAYAAQLIVDEIEQALKS